jgi:hypothetical protein
MRTVGLMQKRELKWIVVLAALAGAYVLFFHNRFDGEQMIINPSLRPSRQAADAVWPVFFSLNDDFKLTSVKVIPLRGRAFDPSARAAWHLISASHSAPLRAFRYGQDIQGMEPALKGAEPEPLEPGVVYRLLVEAGKVTAFKDFETKAATQ